MKLTFALLLLTLAVVAFAQQPNYGITVTYRLLNSSTTAESMSDSTVGVLIFLKTDNGAIAKIEVRLAYTDSDGNPREERRTVSRRQGRGGFDLSTIPVLFGVPLQRVDAIYVEGFGTLHN